MKTAKRAIAQLLLMFPAVLFMGALALRKLQPLQNEPAQTAQQIVMWYSARQWTLRVLLIALPFAVLAIGSVTLARNWQDDMELPQAALQTFAAIRTDWRILVVAAMTSMAGVVLAIVVMHMLAN
jgi:hypothetical protein